MFFLLWYNNDIKEMTDVTIDWYITVFSSSEPHNQWKQIVIQPQKI